MIPLYFVDGIQFASDYIRIVHGGRGDYVEFRFDHIIIPVTSKFGNQIPIELPTSEDLFYYWLTPVGRNEKIYLQNKEVAYADYKIGLCYIEPSLLKPFIEKDDSKQGLF